MKISAYWIIVCIQFIIGAGIILSDQGCGQRTSDPRSCMFPNAATADIVMFSVLVVALLLQTVIYIVLKKSLDLPKKA